MSVDTSKIEVGDWVQQGDTWSRVVEVESYDHNGFFTLKTEADCSGDITAHRPKSGPFKVGDIVQSDFASKCGGCLVIEVDDEYVRMKTHGGTHRDLKNHCTLHRPVEAIEAERDEPELDGFWLSAKGDKLRYDFRRMTEYFDEHPHHLQFINGEIEPKGYRIERIEQPVTLADLPQIGFVDDAGIEWQDIGSNDVWHGGFINYASMAPVEIAEYLTKMSRQLIAEGKLDDAVKERAEVIS